MVEMLDQVGSGVYPIILNDLMERVQKHEPTIMHQHKLLEITDNGVLIEDMKAGEQKHIQADKVCLSLGSVPKKKLVEDFKAAFDKVVVIGSAVKDGRINDATKQGYIKGYVFE